MAFPNNLGVAAFQFEPQYNADEMQERNRRDLRAAEEAEPAHHNQRDRELQLRLEGVTPVIEWCECGRCQVPQNPTAKMVQCCSEHSALDDKREYNNCITGHQDFGPVCLTPAVLHITINSLEEVRGYGINIDDWTNRLYRLVSYRSYTYWIHRRLGRYNRRVIPACVVTAIRNQFPEENEEDYVSYKDVDEVGDAWHM